RLAEILHVDLDVVAVIGRDGATDLTKPETLAVADRDPRGLAVAVTLNRGLRVEDLAIELGDALRGPARHFKFEVRHPEIDRAKAAFVGAVHVELVAPRAGHLDAVVVFVDREPGPGELL